MKKDILKKQISILYEEKRRIMGEIAAYEKELALLNCPYRIGQKVINQKGVKAVVVDIIYKSYGEGYELIGKQIKKSGEISEFIKTLYSFYGWKPVNEREGERCERKSSNG